MSNKPNARRGDQRRTEHGPRYENPNPGAGCNATHVARARTKHKRIGARKARRVFKATLLRDSIEEIIEQRASSPHAWNTKVYKGLRKLLDETDSKGECLVYDRACAVHGFYHGGEASELRDGVEEKIEMLRGLENGDGIYEGLADDLQRLLDTVDARDSVAALEAQRPPPPKKKKRAR